jgi:hypothetical protein
MTNNMIAGSSMVPQVLVSQFLANSETTQLTAAASTTVTIKGATACNISGATVNISVSVVKSGGTAGGSNRVVSVFPLAAGDTLILSQLSAHQLGTGDFISTLASAASAVAFVLSGEVNS